MSGASDDDEFITAPILALLFHKKGSPRMSISAISGVMRKALGQLLDEDKTHRDVCEKAAVAASVTFRVEIGCCLPYRRVAPLFSPAMRADATADLPLLKEIIANPSQLTTFTRSLRDESSAHAGLDEDLQSTLVKLMVTPAGAVYVAVSDITRFLHRTSRANACLTAETLRRIDFVQIERGTGIGTSLRDVYGRLGMKSPYRLVLLSAVLQIPEYRKGLCDQLDVADVRQGEEEDDEEVEGGDQFRWQQKLLNDVTLNPEQFSSACGMWTSGRKPASRAEKEVFAIVFGRPPRKAKKGNVTARNQT